MTEKMKPCPFCGETPEMEISYNDSLERKEYLITCVECGKCVVEGSTEQGAIDSWNKRCLDDDFESINTLVAYIHKLNSNWWIDIETGERTKRNVGELLMLCVSELAEAMEGHRKGLMDDHIPTEKMFDVELADTMIRIFDLAGGMGVDLGRIVKLKLEYNRNRADHKIENRKKDGGKKY